MNLRNRLRPLAGLPLLLFLLFIGLLSTARAFHTPAGDVVVGTGTPASCTESAFDDALATVQAGGGGALTFECGGAPHTIPFSAGEAISVPVTVNGGDLITFSGADVSAFFHITSTGALTLADLTLREGASTSDSHALENYGILALENVTVTDWNTANTLLLNWGDLTINGSRFSDGLVTSNVIPFYGGAIRNDGGDLHISDSTFTRTVIEGDFNSRNGYGGALATLGWGAVATVERTTFNANDAGFGGALANISGTLTIRDSRFTANAAVRGGALHSAVSGTTSVISSTFTANRGGDGGAIGTRGSTLIVEGSKFQANHANSGGGIATWGTHLQLRDSLLEENHANDGGALHCEHGLLTVSGTTFSQNDAGNSGGAVNTFCAARVEQSTFHANVAGLTAVQGGGGAIASNLAVEIWYTTLSDNRADIGGGIYHGTSAPNRYFVQLERSLLHSNLPANCWIVNTIQTPAGGYNLSSDTSCAEVPQSDNLRLLPIGDYGGRTPTMPPAPDSAALDLIPPADCRSDLFPTDQRGVARPQGAGCDAGAVERHAGDPEMPVYLRYLPLVGRESVGGGGE